LSPQNEFDPDLTRAFLHGLAQAVDNTRGILFLLFAEEGLFQNQVFPHIDEFAGPRLDQGVPLKASGPTFLIDLKPPTEEDIRHIIRSRVRPLLAERPEAKDLPAEFPFDPRFVTDVVGTGSVALRNALYRLRDEYSRVAYPKPESLSAETSPGPTARV